MSYLSFMPWTLQKRILRYLLSHLDFIETDDIDLENLGITWGQRSIVELKNIGLKTKKLSSILHLPGFVSFTSARISCLKLTVPADILSSGIVVEISGVEIRLKVNLQDEKKHKFGRSDQRSAPAKGTKSNRPRIAAPTIHDPGGRRVAGYGLLEDSLFLPERAVHQLAESFLQTESRQDRLELQAAIASQSRHEREPLSSSTLSDEEVGTGAPEGYTLPSFIASYLVGIGDRLLLRLKDIVVHVEFEHIHETSNYQQTEPTHSTRFLLRLSELCIESVDLSQNDNGRGTAKRKVILHQVSVLVLIDAASDSSDPGSSITTSPILKHSQSSSLQALSPASNASRGPPALLKRSELADEIREPVSDARRPAQMENSVELRESVLSDQPSESQSCSVDLDNSVDDSALFAATSRRLDPSGRLDEDLLSSVQSSSSMANDDDFQDTASISIDAGSTYHDKYVESSGRFSSGEVDNQGHAEAIVQSGHIVAGTMDTIQSGRGVEDLTESKIFTHDEAESMYMSALSGSTGPAERTDGMPGAWNSAAEHTVNADTPIPIVPVNSTANAVQSHAFTSIDDAGTSSIAEAAFPAKTTPGRNRPSDLPDRLSQIPQIAKQLLVVDRISAWLPVAHKTDLSTIAPSEQPVEFQSKIKDKARSSHAGNDISQSGDLHDASIVASSAGIDANPDTLPIHSLPAVEVEVLNVRIQLDMQLGKSLIGIANSTLTKSEGAGKETQTSSSSAPISTLSVKISNAGITFLEHIPELPISRAATNHHEYDDALLLLVSLAGLAYSRSSSDGKLHQQLHLAKMSLSHSKGQFWSFKHGPTTRNSPKDTVALQKNDVEISLTSSSDTSSSDTNKFDTRCKPIRLILELGQLDDILSRSGGLSSLLELGSSIASTGTMRQSPQNLNEHRSETRGVRFKESSTTERKPQDDLNFGLGKVNVRIGGMNVDVVGSECIMKASTSAIKIVYRTEGVGMQVDTASLQGPFFLDATDVPDLEADLQNIRMEYLPIPTDKDLDRLLAILTPSNDKYDADDDIMVDTLLRQRRKGGVLRLTVTSFMASLQGMSRMANLAKIGNEFGKLSTVAKYLPEDDRPGILTLGLVKTLELDVNIGDPMGRLQLKAESLEGAHVNVPSLLACQIRTTSIYRNQVDKVIGEAVAYSESANVPPLIMCRFVADEMDPTVKLKLFNFRIEYHVMLLTALLQTVDSFSVEGAEDTSERSSQSSVHPASTQSSERAAEFVRRTNISVAIRDSALALNPGDDRGRALFVVADAVISSPLNETKDIHVSAEVKKASVMVIDKVDGDSSSSNSNRAIPSLQDEDQSNTFSRVGYVPVGYISSATTSIAISQSDDDGTKCADIEFGNALFIVESCADSTQTLIDVLNGLSPPAPPLKLSPYRTEIMPIEDLLASFSGDAFVTQPGPEAGLRAESRADSSSMYSNQQDIEYVSEFYQTDLDDEDDLSDSGIHSEMLDSDIAESTVSISVTPVSIKQSVSQATNNDSITNSLLDFRDEHFGRTSAVGGTAHRWDSTQNTYGLASERHVSKSPLKLRIRDVHIIWNLFDGYDWQGTRDAISEAVKDIETRAAARRPRSSRRLSPGADEEEESVIGDFLFNSIYIGVPANKDPRELASEINREIDDVTSESGSYATTSTITGSPARHQATRPRQKKLKLNRSKQHKMTFELKGISADMLVFPPGSGEVQSSIDIRVKDMEIFDHVPTSTWKKFATYMRDAGEREANTSMIHIEILNVKPVPDLAASEIILKVTILPLRLHVDQDALDFMSRFFEFKDESAPPQSTPSTPPFLQRVEVNPVKIKLDFKPKRVDYGGLRSGRTTEFMNFFVLDQADMILRRVILYGVSGFDRLGIMLNNIWMPDVRRNQLPGILAGIAPIRSLVNVGSGVKDLIVIPMREYRKDGRIVRSIQKGALAFAKTTSKELIGLGAKLAIGTQTVLQNAETLLAPTSSTYPGDHPYHASSAAGEDPDASDDNETRKQISLYADQPLGVVQGLRGAYASLERDLLLAKDAIIAVPGEVMASGSAAGAAKAILKQAPTVILRPAIGASKAVGQTLLGAGNTLDRDNWRRAEEKYKRY